VIKNDTKYVRAHDAILASIACFNVLLHGGLMFIIKIATKELLLWLYEMEIWRWIFQSEVRSTLRRKFRKGIV